VSCDSKTHLKPSRALLSSSLNHIAPEMTLSLFLLSKPVLHFHASGKNPILLSSFLSTIMLFFFQKRRKKYVFSYPYWLVFAGIAKSTRWLSSSYSSSNGGTQYLSRVKGVEGGKENEWVFFLIFLCTRL
jgi:hypothetical protein